MKNLFTTFFLIMLCLRSFADNETLNYLYTDPLGSQQWVDNIGGVGVSNPCSGFAVRVLYSVPTGYTLTKYQWYVNTTLQKTTTNAGDNVAVIALISSNHNVVRCDVTYTNNSNGSTVVRSSNTFDFAAKILAVDLSQANDAIAGCTSTVNFNTVAITGNSFLYTPPSYTVSWQPPANWVQTSISGDGHSVSFTPDGLTGGTLSATVTMPPCGFTEILTRSIVRIAPAPGFASSNPVTGCTGAPVNYSINGICGASSYTYSITGFAGVVFSANSLQTLTTSATTVGISFPASSGIATLSVVANYPNGVSSASTSTDMHFGVPNVSVSVTLDCPDGNALASGGDPAATYTWHLVDVATGNQTITTGGITKIYHDFTATRNVCVEYSSACGTSNTACVYNLSCGSGGTHGHSIKNSSVNGSLSVFADSAGGNGLKGLTIYPNPVRDNLVIDLGSNSMNGLTGIRSVSLYNSLGVLTGTYQYPAMPRSVTIYLKDLSPGIYLVKIEDGKTGRSKAVLITK